MPQQVGDTGPSNALQVAHMQLANGIEQNSLTAQQFQNMPGGNPNANARVGAYNANMAQQQAQQAQMKPMPNAGGPQNQGSPMMNQVQEGGAIANYYNPGEIGPNGIRGAPGGQPGGSGGNHALQDYQMQLMLLEQQNKKRLMMARQEQDNMIPRPDGQGGPGPNGQPFQGTSPQGGPRNSPNPGDQMKRGTPHMNNAGMPSPLPEGQSRGSPSNGMNFNMPGGPMDPTMNPQYFNKMDGMNPNMVPGMNPAGMRPPSSHPGGAFNSMTPQQMALARQQQQQAQQVAQGQWPAGGPNGQMMQQPNAQGPPQQQNMGTPQQRNMAPPAVPAAGAAANGRATSSPQQNPAPPTPSQTNKANPKKKAATESKDSKAKVYFCVKWIFCRNVDIDDSGLQRRDRTQTSTLVLHHPPTPMPPPRHPRPRLRSHQFTSKASITVQTALSSQSRMVNSRLQTRMLSCLLNRIQYFPWTTMG